MKRALFCGVLFSFIVFGNIEHGFCRNNYINSPPWGFPQNSEESFVERFPVYSHYINGFSLLDNWEDEKAIVEFDDFIIKMKDNGYAQDTVLNAYFGKIVALDRLGEKDLCAQTVGNLVLRIAEEAAENKGPYNRLMNYSPLFDYKEFLQQISKRAPTKCVRAFLLSMVDDLEDKDDDDDDDDDDDEIEEENLNSG